jgi:hypothetical protein
LARSTNTPATDDSAAPTAEQHVEQPVEQPVDESAEQPAEQFMSRAERRAAGRKRQPANPSGAPHGTASIRPTYAAPVAGRSYAARRSG